MFRCSALHDTSIRGAAAASRRSQVPSGPLVRVSSLRRSYRRAGTHLCRARENETKEEALQRRLRESDRVEERLIGVHTEDELRVQLEQVSRQWQGGLGPLKPLQDCNYVHGAGQRLIT